MAISPVILRASQGGHNAYCENKAQGILSPFRSPEFRDFSEHLHELGYVCIPELLALFPLRGVGIPD